MTIQVSRMKYSNEQVIADISEVYQEDDSKEKGERPICLSFGDPYSLHVVDETENGYNVTFKKWNPFSDDQRYNVGFDLIGLISNCKTAVADAYTQRVAIDTKPQEENNEETPETE